MQTYFRDAVRGDIPAIATILREATRHDGIDHSTPVGTYREALDEIDRADGNYVLVAEYDSQIVAMVQLLVFRHLHRGAGRCAQVVALHVATAYRTTGVGAMLLEHAIGRARDIGCARLQVLSSTAATDEHPFWERAGFVQLDRGYVRPLH